MHSTICVEWTSDHFGLGLHEKRFYIFVHSDHDLWPLYLKCDGTTTDLSASVASCMAPYKNLTIIIIIFKPSVHIIPREIKKFEK